MLSAKVAEKIKALDHSTESTRDSAVAYLRNAEEHSEKSEDKAAFAVLSGALSMAYDAQASGYAPMLVMSDGQRSFSMEDLDDSGAAIIEEALPLFGPF